jgi:hypothetical protein
MKQANKTIYTNKKYQDIFCAPDHVESHEGIQQSAPTHKQFVPTPDLKHILQHFWPYGGKLVGGQHHTPKQQHYTAKPAHFLKQLNQQH